MVTIVTIGIVVAAVWMQRQERARQRDVQLAQATNP
jgi:hypothetical protein